jgi:hypothetical protein
VSNAAHTVEHPRTPRRSALLVSGTLIAAAAAATVPLQPASAAPGRGADCVIEVLPMPDGHSFSIVTGMSDDGSVIAYRAYDLQSYVRYPYLYEDGEVTEVPIPGEDQQIADVNEDGLAVGFTYLDGMQLPYVFRDGKLAELAANDGGMAHGVNEDGDIVGVTGQYPEIPVIWRDGEVKPVELPLPDNAVSGEASAIDDDGTIVGHYEDAETGAFKPYLWHPDGTGEELPMPKGVDPATAHSYAADIADGWVSGYLGTDAGVTGIRWNLEDGTAEALDLEFAPAVNEEGTAAGEAFPHAAYQEEDGKAVKLPGLSDPDDNWFGDSATEVDDDGEVFAGQSFAGEDADGGHILKAVLWTCD